MKFFNICLSLFILLSIFTICRTEEVDCVYTIYVKTGSLPFAGTDSKISLTLYPAKGSGIHIPDLEKWGGLMGPKHNYFENGNLDIFTGKGRCLNGPVCKIHLQSDGSGHLSSWYCSYVEVTTTGVNRKCAKNRFTIDQYLSKILFPFKLTATKDDCKRMIDSHDLFQISDVNEGMIDGPDSSQISDIEKHMIDGHDLSQISDINERLIDDHDSSQISDIEKHMIEGQDLPKVFDNLGVGL